MYLAFVINDKYECRMGNSNQLYFLIFLRVNMIPVLDLNQRLISLLTIMSLMLFLGRYIKRTEHRNKTSSVVSATC